jgi:hypothetical protein
MFLLNIRLSRKPPFQKIERRYETAYGIFSQESNPSPLKNASSSGEADDTSFEKLQNVPLRKAEANSCSERTSSELDHKKLSREEMAKEIPKGNLNCRLNNRNLSL